MGSHPRAVRKSGRRETVLLNPARNRPAAALEGRAYGVEPDKDRAGWRGVCRCLHVLLMVNISWPAVYRRPPRPHHTQSARCGGLSNGCAGRPRLWRRARQGWGWLAWGELMRSCASHGEYKLARSIPQAAKVPPYSKLPVRGEQAYGIPPLKRRNRAWSFCGTAVGRRGAPKKVDSRKPAYRLPLFPQQRTWEAPPANVSSCEGLSDTCRCEVSAALCVGRQVSDKPQGRKPRADLGSVVRPARSMGI